MVTSSDKLASRPRKPSGSPRRDASRAGEPLFPRHQRFVEHYATSKNAAEAARLAGYQPHYAAKRAYALLRRPDVRAALLEIQAHGREQAKLDVETMTARIKARIDESREAKQFTAAAKLEELLAKLHGLLVDRQQLELKDQPSLLEAIETGRARAGLSRRDAVDVDSAPVPPGLPNTRKEPQ